MKCSTPEHFEKKYSCGEYDVIIRHDQITFEYVKDGQRVSCPLFEFKNKLYVYGDTDVIELHTTNKWSQTGTLDMTIVAPYNIIAFMDMIAAGFGVFELIKPKKDAPGQEDHTTVDH